MLIIYKYNAIIMVIMEKPNIDELVVWVKDGKYRIKILRVLEKDKLISSEIAQKINNHRSTTSRILKNLKDKQLITSINAGSRTIMYFITDLGKEVLKTV